MSRDHHPSSRASLDARREAIRDRTILVLQVVGFVAVTVGIAALWTPAGTAVIMGIVLFVGPEVRQLSTWLVLRHAREIVSIPQDAAELDRRR